MSNVLLGHVHNFVVVFLVVVLVVVAVVFVVLCVEERGGRGQ